MPLIFRINILFNVQKSLQFYDNVTTLFTAKGSPIAECLTATKISARLTLLGMEGVKWHVPTVYYSSLVLYKLITNPRPITHKLLSILRQG